MRLLLVPRSGSAEARQRLALPEGRSLVIGRSAVCDLPIYDPTMSRRHASLRAKKGRLRVEDLGSTNGTRINGVLLSAPGEAGAGDVLTFGGVELDVVYEELETGATVRPSAAERAAAERTPAGRPPAPPRRTEPRAEETGARTDPPAAPSQPAPPPAPPTPTLLREMQRPMPAAPSFEGPIVPSIGVPSSTGELVIDLEGGAQERLAMRLALLLDVSKELSRQPEVDRLLDKVADLTFRVMDVDRVAIEVLDEESGELVSTVRRGRDGSPVEQRFVPASIARRATEEKVALLTEDAPGDSRFSTRSIILHRVQCALCAPLLGREGRVVGLLYVDNTTAPHSLGDEDLNFLVAFAGIAAVALENSRLIERTRREAVVRANFQRYFAPDLALRILDQEGALEPGGDRCRAVILFADIRGFTGLAAGLTPEEIATLLNDFFTEMARVIFDHGGVLDKFIGDAVMALWGVPVADPRAGERALAAAAQMQRAVARLSARRMGAGQPPLAIGIGVNAGEVFAGNLGSAERLEYTVIGDPVNVAARLCDLAEGGEILVAEELVRSLAEPPARGETRELPIRGRDEPLRAVSYRHAAGS